MTLLAASKVESVWERVLWVPTFVCFFGGIECRRGTLVFGSRQWLIWTVVVAGIGIYVAASDTPYRQRGLPPVNLCTWAGNPEHPYNGYVHTGRKSFLVLGGPVAPCFGQPALGAQVYVGGTGNILNLLNFGYLGRVNNSKIDLGPAMGNDGQGL